MPKKEATEAVPLSVMLGFGSDFLTQGKTYIVKPLKLNDNDEFNSLNYGSQYFTINDPESKGKLEKFMERYLFDANGEPMTIEKAGIDDWDIADLKNFLKKVIEISG